MSPSRFSFFIFVIVVFRLIAFVQLRKSGETLDIEVAGKVKSFASYLIIAGLCASTFFLAYLDYSIRPALADYDQRSLTFASNMAKYCTSFLVVVDLLQVLTVKRFKFTFAPKIYTLVCLAFLFLDILLIICAFVLKR